MIYLSYSFFSVFRKEETLCVETLYCLVNKVDIKWEFCLYLKKLIKLIKLIICHQVSCPTLLHYVTMSHVRAKKSLDLNHTFAHDLFFTKKIFREVFKIVQRPWEIGIGALADHIYAEFFKWDFRLGLWTGDAWCLSTGQPTITQIPKKRLW